MEEVRLLHEVMAELPDNGYVTNFGLMKYIFLLVSGGLEKKTVSGSEFTIDEITAAMKQNMTPKLFTFLPYPVPDTTLKELQFLLVWNSIPCIFLWL